jgi:hypothetical protein
MERERLHGHVAEGERCMERENVQWPAKQALHYIELMNTIQPFQIYS